MKYKYCSNIINNNKYCPNCDKVTEQGKNYLALASILSLVFRNFSCYFIYIFNY